MEFLVLWHSFLTSGGIAPIPISREKPTNMCEVQLTSKELEKATHITNDLCFFNVVEQGGNITYTSYYWSSSHMAYAE